MENKRNRSIAARAKELFMFYDRAGIGMISKKSFLYYLGLIDSLITEEWLSKILIANGLSLGQFIDCNFFIQIMSILQSVSQQEPLSENQIQN